MSRRSTTPRAASRSTGISTPSTPSRHTSSRSSVYGGTTVGPTQATETITAGGQSHSSIRSFSVDDSNPSNGTVGGATHIDTAPGNDSVQMSALPTAGAVDYYTIPMPAAGTRISVHLTNLPADYDLALYSPQSTSVRTGATLAPPLQDGIVPDTQVNLNNGSSGQLTPTGLEDIPDPGIPLRQLSDNRHHDDEDVGLVSPGGGGNITIAVFGYNGAFSPDAYTLRVREYAPPATQVVRARTFDHLATARRPTRCRGTSRSFPANVNTIILVNEKRLGDTYGSTAATDAVSSLDHLATDTIARRQRCGRPRRVHSRRPDALRQLGREPVRPERGERDRERHRKRGRPDRRGPPEHPVRRLRRRRRPDPVLPPSRPVAGREREGLRRPVRAQRVPGLSRCGRPAERRSLPRHEPGPGERPAALPAEPRRRAARRDGAGHHERRHQLRERPDAGRAAELDGIRLGLRLRRRRQPAGGGQPEQQRREHVDAHRRSAAAPTSLFGSSDLFAAAFPTGGPADINSWNGHYDNYRAQMANGDIISTSDLAGRTLQLSGGVFFTMGCHAGFQTTDALVGSTGVLDWPQYFAHTGTGFVGNTGFGLGDTDSVAFSEELMADFAGNIGNGTYARQRAAAGEAAVLPLASGVLELRREGALGGRAVRPADVRRRPRAGPARCSRPPSSFARSGARRDDARRARSRDRSRASRAPACRARTSPRRRTSSARSPAQNGQYYTNDGQVQAPNYRPLQPYRLACRQRDSRPRRARRRDRRPHEPGRPGDRAERLRARQR